MQTINTNYKNILQTMTEIWKVYPHKTNKVHLLEVSNLGNIKYNGILIDFKNQEHKRYYMICGMLVHRMVALLFVPNPDNKPQIDHINTNKHDNRAINLRWVTPKENSNNSLTKLHQSIANKEAQNRPEVKLNNSNKHKNRKLTKEHKHKTSLSMMGQNVGKRHMSNDIDHVFIKPDKIEYYLSLGYHFGMK